VQAIREGESNQAQLEELKLRLQEHKRTLLMGMLVLAAFICYCPFIITTIIDAVKGRDVTEDFKYIAIPIAVSLANLQSLVNPLTVSLRMSAIRKGVTNKLLFKFNSEDVQDNSTSTNDAEKHASFELQQIRPMSPRQERA